MSPALVIVLVGSFVAAACALVGSFLVLRRMALLGDAISHAVLPGIVIAFLLTGSRATLPMLLGAGALGVVTVFLVEALNRTRRLSEDASIGVVFPALFSAGVVLVSRYAGQVDLDLECVLYGDIAYTPLYVWEWGGRSIGPKALWVTGGVLLVNLLLVVGLYKELKLTTFDPELAASLGYWPVLVHYVLMTAVSLTVVACFESVGAILVVALLVVPPATAYLLTHRLRVMLVLAVAAGVVSSVAGYELARWCDGSIAGGMATAAGALFLAVLLLAPRHGLLARAVAYRRLALRLAGQLLLLHLKDSGELMPAEEVQRRFRWQGRRWRQVVRELGRTGLVEASDGRLRLTAAGAEALETAGATPLAHRL